MFSSGNGDWRELHSCRIGVRKMSSWRHGAYSIMPWNNDGSNADNNAAVIPSTSGRCSTRANTSKMANDGHVHVHHTYAKTFTCQYQTQLTSTHAPDSNLSSTITRLHILSVVCKTILSQISKLGSSSLLAAGTCTPPSDASQMAVQATCSTAPDHSPYYLYL